MPVPGQGPPALYSRCVNQVLGSSQTAPSETFGISLLKMKSVTLLFFLLQYGFLSFRHTVGVPYLNVP